MLKIVSWNVNGIRAAYQHGLATFLDTCDADIYAFQETKTNEPFLSVEREGYYAYWSHCRRRKGYAGTLCLTRYRPLAVRYDLGDPDFDTEGRIITLEYAEFYFVNVYVPNAQRSGLRREYRYAWDLRLVQYIYQLRSQKPVIVGGDFNVALTGDDIYAENDRAERDGIDFMSTEREHLTDLIENGLTDTYRLIHPDARGQYSWWSNRRNKRDENRGWRLDYLLVSDTIRGQVRESTMLADVLGSDHCPIVLDLDLRLEADEAPPGEATRSLCEYTYRDIFLLNEHDPLLHRLLRTDLTRMWDGIDWLRVENSLAYMQKQLALAAYSRNMKSVEHWQRKIAGSMDAKVLAVRHTCLSSGEAGVDSIKWTTSHEKMVAALSLSTKEYRSTPPRMVVVTTHTGRQRSIQIDTYFDKAMQTLMLFALNPVAETWGDKLSFAYRKGRSAFDADAYIKRIFSGENAPQWAIVGDVRRCFDNISHEWIVDNIPLPKNVLRQFLNAGYILAGEVHQMEEGIGQGRRLSPIIANMTLDGMEQYLMTRLDPLNTSRDDKLRVVRSADDFVVPAHSSAEVGKLKRYLDDFLEERGLELSPQKTKIVHVSDSFDFMSRTYYKVGTQLCSRPSEAAVKRFIDNLGETITSHTGSQRRLIETLNHMIDGWSSYHKVSEADEIFRRVDAFIDGQLLRLCETRHPGWTREKIIKRYWQTGGVGVRYYALTNKKEVRVRKLADTQLIDYNPVWTNMNPYLDVDYLERRNRERQINNVTGVYRSIWRRQEGKCFYCQCTIARDEPKGLVEVFPQKRHFAARMAYVHERCMGCHIEFVEAENLPSSQTEVLQLLQELAEGHRTVGNRYYSLLEFFRTCDKPVLTLTFREIEGILGRDLGASANHKEFWYRTGFGQISQCWLQNGYQIARLHLQERKRVVFTLSTDRQNTVGVKIPRQILNGRIPKEAKLELERYLEYLTAKYGLYG